MCEHALYLVRLQRSDIDKASHVLLRLQRAVSWLAEVSQPALGVPPMDQASAWAWIKMLRRRLARLQVVFGDEVSYINHLTLYRT